MPIVLLLAAGAALAFYLYRSPASTSSDSSTAADGSGVFDPYDPQAPPQGGQLAAGQAFSNTAEGATTTAPGLMLPRLQLPKIQAKPPRDLNPQFQSKAQYDLAVRLNPDPKHLIPHMLVQEGTHIKYEDVRGGSQTIAIPH